MAGTQTEPERDYVSEAVRALTLQLSEFGDVQVLVSYVKGDATVDLQFGEGNFNTRVQLCRAFVKQADEFERLRVEDEFCGYEDEDDDSEFHTSDCDVN